MARVRERLSLCRPEQSGATIQVRKPSAMMINAVGPNPISTIAIIRISVVGPIYLTHTIVKILVQMICR